MSSCPHLLSAASSCMINFSDPEGYIDSSDDPPLPDGAFLQCTYTVTVYTGYGVELQACLKPLTISHFSTECLFNNNIVCSGTVWKHFAYCNRISII